MAKTTKRRTQVAAQAGQRLEWKRMTPEQLLEFNAHRRIRTAKSGYAKRQRERNNGAGMSLRTHESPAWHRGITDMDAKAFARVAER